jgi:HEAT repeat protein/energy-coupling factor transporter ATP-binding protein EcfA2
MQQWRWSKANEKDLAKFVSRDAVKLLDKLRVNPFDLNHDSKGRKELVRAIYNALVARNIRYAHEEYQPEGGTQIIRPPHEILRTPGEGTCLDLAVLFCGLCLGYKLLPLIVILEGHAFAAVSLNHPLDRWNDSFAKERNLFITSELFRGEENLTALKKLIDEEAYIAIECTGFAQTQSFKNLSQPEAKHREDDGTLSFDNALNAGREQLENPDRSFKFAIDIAVAHHHWEIECWTTKDDLEYIAWRINDDANTPAHLLEQFREIIAARGNRSVAINRDANGAFIITGDNNVILNIPSQGDVFQAGDFRYSRGAEVLRSLLWQNGSRTLLAEQLRLTTNPLTQGQGISYQVEDVYVPLGLLERKKQPIQRQDITPEQGSDLGREMGIDRSSGKTDDVVTGDNREAQVEITKQFKHDEFLNEVFLQGQSPKSQGKRIAIIGEPGAGKTTLLQQIARWIERTFPSAIVIWVSLADLKDKELEDYLETQWLRSLLRQSGGADVSTAMKEIFGTHLQQGQVWLLLDGLDEMQGNNPLSEIQRQIQAGGWLQQMRIVMTCRLNLWDGNRNGLETFDTYRTLEFAYPEQVEMFIEKWFAPRGVGSSERGKKLCMALKEPGNERIRALMKNPLRLSLMCFSWFLKDEEPDLELPKTQAELYKRFVEQIYEWKKEKFPTTTAQKEQLNHKLAELSKAAIDDEQGKGKGRFRLREDFVKRFLDKDIPQGKGTFLELALRLGWLNKVGLDADDRSRSIYAFFHATFQEYFAALGIDDDRFFLTLVPKLNPLAPSASYRVFEPQWRQVFLLWLGREDLDKSRKEALIQTLLKFKDRCGDFYTDRAFLLAAVGIAEFNKDCSRADAIVDKLVQWAFPSPDRWLSPKIFKNRGREAARVEWATNTFSRTDPQRVIRSILRVLATTQYKSTRRSAAASLSKIDPGNETAIQVLVGVLKTTQDDDTRRSAAASLGKIDPGNETAIQALVGVLATTQDGSTCQIAGESLGEIGTGNETAIQALVGVLATTQDDFPRQRVAASLGKIGTGNKTAMINPLKFLALAPVLVGMRKTIQYEFTRRIAAEILGEIGTGNETAIQVLVWLLKTTQSEYTRRSAAASLGKIDTDNETAIQALVWLLATTQDDDTRRSTAESLGKIDHGNETAIQVLVGVLETTQDDSIRRSVAASLGEIGTGNETAIHALVRVLATTQDSRLRRSAAESLGKIGTGNETAIHALVRVLATTQDESTRWRAAESLGKIGTGNETAIHALVRVLATPQDESTRRSAAASLGKIDPGNETAIHALVRVLATIQDESTRRSAAASLVEIDPGNETAIQALIWLLATTQDDDTRWKAAASLVEIDPGNETAIQALVGVLKTTQNDDTRRSVEASLVEIDPGNYETAIQALVGVLKTTQNNYTRRSAAEILGKIGTGNQTTMKVLLRSLRSNSSNKEAHTLMMKCAESLSYRDFYQAFHNK